MSSREIVDGVYIGYNTEKNGKQANSHITFKKTNLTTDLTYKNF